MLWVIYTSFVFVGIDIHQLRFELCSGIRLPVPANCPASISTMIQSCFDIDPYQRPNFKHIKTHLSNAYDALMRAFYSKDNSNVKDSRCKYATLPSIKDANYSTMRKLYDEIRKNNEKHPEQNSLFSNNDASNVKKGNSSSLQYISLENIMKYGSNQEGFADSLKSNAATFGVDGSSIGSLTSERKACLKSILRYHTLPLANSVSERKCKTDFVFDARKKSKSLS